jgi:hydroxypyruvate isomerase
LHWTPDSTAASAKERNVKLAANVSMIFRDLPFADRIPAAAAAGFQAVEMYWPEPGELPRTEQARFVQDVSALGIQVVQLNFITGERLGVDSGVAGEPDRAHLFRANVPEAVELAARLGCRRINALAGNRLSGVSHGRQVETLLESVGMAADAAASEGISVMVETLNRTDHPSFLLPDIASVMELLDRLDQPNVRLLFDVYHAAMTGEDVPAAIRRAGPMIGNVQLADVPGRNEPGTGEIDFAAVLRELALVGYDDWIACEYIPRNAEDPIGALSAVKQSLFEVAAGLGL